MSAVDVFDDHVCVWVRGQDEPVARIPVHAANSHLLWRLLHERVTSALPEPEAPPAGGLGRVLFERKPSRTNRIGLWAAAGMLALFGLLALLAAVQGEWELALPALLMGGFMGLLGALLLSQAKSFHCHQFGVRKRFFGREQHVRYADVNSFTYQAVRQFVNGVYSHTSVRMVFLANGEQRPHKLVYSAALRNIDAELDQLRDHISQIIASRMRAALAQGERVPWTSRLAFLSDGLEFRPAGLLGRKTAEVVPYGELRTFSMNGGVFQLWRSQRKKAILREEISKPNFFPGFFLLLALIEPADSQPVAELEDATD
jgi:hypothetical protein